MVKVGEGRPGGMRGGCRWIFQTEMMGFSKRTSKFELKSPILLIEMFVISLKIGDFDLKWCFFLNRKGKFELNSVILLTKLFFIFLICQVHSANISSIFPLEHPEQLLKNFKT